jgi:Ni,Fe-hydrogenase III component G
MTAMDSDSFAAIIAPLTEVPHHRPWRRFAVDAETWSAIGKALGDGEGELVSLWGDADAVHMAVRAPPAEPCVVSLPVTAGTFPSFGVHHPPAIRLERAVCDLYGHVPQGPAARVAHARCAE